MTQGQLRRDNLPIPVSQRVSTSEGHKELHTCVRPVFRTRLAGLRVFNYMSVSQLYY